MLKKEFEAYQQVKVILPESIKPLVLNQDFIKLDQELKKELSPKGSIYQKLADFIDIKKIEFIISLRKGEEDEDGIWHDDGSRELAFSLSLTLEPYLQGGELLIRRKANESKEIKIETPSFSDMIVFKTGQWGFEHKVLKVEKGARIICAGWIN